MKRINDLRKIVVLALSCLAVLCFAFTLNTFSTKADATPATATIYMQKGARVRTAGIVDGRNGISWQLAMDATTYGQIESSDVSYGVLIAPADYGELNEATVFAEDGEFWWKQFSDNAEINKADGKKQIWNLETDTLTVKEGVAYFNGSLVDVLPENIYREFNAVGYMKYLDGTQTKYKFAESNDNVRTMTYVALRYLESEQNTLNKTQEQTFRAKYVDPAIKSVGVTFNVNGTTQDETLDLAISEVYSANKLAKLADVTITDLIKSADSVDNFKIAKDTDRIDGEVKFESVESLDLVGTYALTNGTLKLELDGTASVTKGTTTTYGDWKMAFDKNLYSTVAMVATSSAETSMIVGIEKTASAYALVNDGESYAQTASGAKTLFAAMEGKYKAYYKYESGTEVYANGVEIRLSNGVQEVATSGLGNAGAVTFTPISGAFGSYTGATSGNGKGYYIRIDGTYYLFNQAANNGLNHYGLNIKNGSGSRLDDTLEDTIYSILAGEYSYSSGSVSGNAKITTDLLTTTNNSNDKGLRYGNGRSASGKVNTTNFGTALDLLLKSKTTGTMYFRANTNNGTATPSSGCPYFIAGDKVVFAENNIAGLTFVKGANTTLDTYLDAIRTYIAGKYLGLDGFNLELKADGTATLNGDAISYVVNPERTVGASTTGSGAKSIYKGNIVLTLTDNSAVVINYDFTYGRTILTATGVDAMQIR